MLILKFVIFSTLLFWDPVSLDISVAQFFIIIIMCSIFAGQIVLGWHFLRL